MANVWSFNTTIRNPERMENLLRVLQEMEGENFDEDGQRMFFGLQIKKRFYKPTRAKLGNELYAEFDAVSKSDDIPDEIVEKILDKYDGQVDAAGRGRTSVAVLNRFGLTIALQSNGPVKINNIAKKWINSEIDDQELFTRLLLKWQYTNPLEDGYEGSNVRPLPATLKLIDLVNTKWESLGNKVVGLSKDEYKLFVPQLLNVTQIESDSDEIIRFRKKCRSLSGRELTQFIEDYSIKQAVKIFGNPSPTITAKNLRTLRDYADSSIRYFKTTGLIALRGGGRYVDLSKDKAIEVTTILDSVPLHAKEFETSEDYVQYLNDISENLPWINENDLFEISSNLERVLKEETQESEQIISTFDLESKNSKEKIEILEEQINKARIDSLRKLKHDLEALDESLDMLKKLMGSSYSPTTARPSLDFEWYVSRALMVLNDAIRIEPSFKIGDDGIPTGFRGNASDIECEYEDFGMTVEVTLLSGRDQWHAEGQPVMRHLRDFENSEQLGGKSAYCIFVAPYIHRDSLNTFWTSNKYEYEGSPQKIIPITIDEFIALLTIAKEKISKGVFTSATLKTLLENLYSGVSENSESQAWRGELSQKISSWAM